MGVSEAIWEFIFSIMYGKVDLPFLDRSALPWTYTEARLALCTVWCVVFACCEMTLLITQAAAKALLHVLRGSLWCCGKTLRWWWVQFWAKKMISDIRLHWGNESSWSLVYLSVQQYSLWYCTCRRNCGYWLESMLSRKLPPQVIWWGFGPPKLGLWSLRFAIMVEPT